jgi:dTDP-4-amino-4,6-dideoxygalactose transaminase
MSASDKTPVKPVADSHVSKSPQPLSVPRLPVLGWETFSGPRASAFPTILDAPNRTFTNSGRAAIALALKSMSIRRGDRVLVPTYHCPTMIAPIVDAGGIPTFFPIDRFGAPHLDAIEPSAATARAMIVAHYFGLPQPMSAIRRYCDERGVLLIEDCAHAMFGVVEGRPIGAWGDFAIASFTKFLPTTDGGCVVSTAPRPFPSLKPLALIDELRIVANAFEMGAARHRLPGLNGALSLFFSCVNRIRKSAPLGNSSRIDSAPLRRNWLDDFKAGSGIWSQASVWARLATTYVHRERIISNRRRNYERLATLLSDLPGTSLVQPKLPGACAPYVFPLWVEDPEKTYQSVRLAGIPVFRWDEVWPTTPAMNHDRGLEWSSRVFQIGCHQDLRPADIELIAKRLRDIFA